MSSQPPEPDWDALTEMVTEAAADNRGPWVLAQFDGTCALCGARYEGGWEDVRYDPDCDGWVCTACGSADVT